MFFKNLVLLVISKIIQVAPNILVFIMVLVDIFDFKRLGTITEVAVYGMCCNIIAVNGGIQMKNRAAHEVRWSTIEA